MKILHLLLALASLSLATLQGAVPTISSFQPTFGSAGQPITIFGRNFTSGGQPQVFFGGGLFSASLSSVSDTKIVAAVPTGATIGPIIVRTPNGDAQTTDFLAAPGITSFIRQNPAPLTDDENHRGNPKDTIFVEGFNFEAPTGPITIGVFFGALPAQFETRGSGALVLTIPDAGVTGPIIVTNKGGRFTTDSDYFYIPPIITNFTAKAAVGAQITLGGKSFLGVTNVQIDSLVIPNFAIRGPTGTNIVFTLPTNAPTSGKISVISSGNIFITATKFLLLPSITGISTVGAAPGASITITGYGLTGATTVSFGGISATPSAVSSTSVKVTVPVGALSGPLVVSTPNGTGSSASNFLVAPRISGFNPTQGIPDDLITITGANFVGATSVGFSNAVASNFTVQSATTIQVTVPANAKTGPIRVTNPGGTAVSATAFRALGTLPMVTSFSPAFGPTNSTVTINGTNFTTAIGVQFNGTPAANFTVVSDTKITAFVPFGATTGPISVFGPDGPGTSTASFFVGSSADLSLQLSATPSSPVADADLVVNFTLSNQGPLQATAARATFTGASVTTITDASSSIGTPTMTTSNAVFNFGDLGVGSAITGQVKLHVNTNATFTLTMAATSATPDSNPANNTKALNLQSSPIVLNIFSVSANSIHLSWPMVSSSYILEKTPKLVPPGWLKVAETPESDGSQYFLNLPLGTNAVFFRLRKP